MTLPTLTLLASLWDPSLPAIQPAPIPPLMAQASSSSIPLEEPLSPDPIPAANDLQDPSTRAEVLDSPPSTPAASDPGTDPLSFSVRTESLRLRSDQQTFNQQTQIFEATGNVEMEFGRSILRADFMRIDLVQRIVEATGTVQVEVGNQQVEGQRLEYNFSLEQGVLEQVTGQVDTNNLSADVAASGLANDPLEQSVLTPERQEPRLLRFTADRITFDATTWEGENVRVTNDQYDPPELQVRAPRAQLELRPDGSGVLTAQPAQLAFDNAVFLPFPLRLQIDQFQRQTPISIFYDDFDREELRRRLIIQPNFELSEDPNLSFVLSPQIYPQRFSSDQGIGDGLGLQTTFQAAYVDGQLTRILGEIRGLVFEEFADRLRFQVEHVIPTGDGGRVTYSYDYRERFFNGLLGFQIVQNRLGARYNSPVIDLGPSGVDLSYQVAIDQIQAPGQDPIEEDFSQAKEDTDQQLELTRLQLATALSRSFPLWSPELPELTETLEGPPPELRFSPSPIQEGIWLNTGVSSSQAYYSNGETQSYVAGSVGIDAVVGRFVADAFDYTNLNVTYSNGFLSGASPFLFDRITTREQLILGILQQVYGPVRAGAETTIDLQSGRRVDTTYTLGYDRRTYGVNVHYNPVRQTGALELRVENFNWLPSDATGITPVRGGIEREPGR